jgi:hypothetical protein
MFFANDTQAQPSYSCTFASSYTECGFTEQAKLPVPPGRATIVGPTAIGSLTSEGVYSATGLALGSHTRVITNTSGAYVAVDGFWVNPIAPN